MNLLLTSLCLYWVQWEHSQQIHLKVPANGPSSFYPSSLTVPRSSLPNICLYWQSWPSRLYTWLFTLKTVSVVTAWREDRKLPPCDGVRKTRCCRWWSSSGSRNSCSAEGGGGRGGQHSVCTSERTISDSKTRPQNMQLFLCLLQD